MSFLAGGPLRHSSGEVRDKAEQLIIALYKRVGAPVRLYLSSSIDENSRKSLLYKQLFRAFDDCDAASACTTGDDNNNVRHGNRISNKHSKRDNRVCIRHNLPSL